MAKHSIPLFTEKGKLSGQKAELTEQEARQLQSRAQIELRGKTDRVIRFSSKGQITAFIAGSAAPLIEIRC